MKILIHHHTKPCLSNKGIHVQSFIGSWISELSNYFTQIGLLMQTDHELKKEHDFLLSNDNIVLHDYKEINTPSFFQRNQYLINVCKEISYKYDVLLIRGITPKQKIIYDNCDIKKKYFLMVGSLNDSRPRLKINKTGLIVWFLYWSRRRELKNIAKGAQLFSNSKGVVKELQEIFKTEAIFTPTNTINSKDFIPFKDFYPTKKIRVLFCGRVVKEKGIEELLIAIEAVRSKGLDVMIDIVGKCPPEYEPKLFNLLKQLKVPSSKINFHGFIPFGEKLLEFYRNSDIYILPSWHEGFPHSIWEAAASCTPVIVSPVGGIPSLITNQDVLFCKLKDSNSIAECIIKIINNPRTTNEQIRSLYKLAFTYNSNKCAQLMFNEILKS